MTDRTVLAGDRGDRDLLLAAQLVREEQAARLERRLGEAVDDDPRLVDVLDGVEAVVRGDHQVPDDYGALVLDLVRACRADREVDDVTRCQRVVVRRGGSRIELPHRAYEARPGR